MYLGRQTQGGPSANQVKRDVVQVIVHPDYQDSLLYDGVALMKLSRPVTFSDNVRPICLASSSSWFSNGTSCLATGLGRPNLAGESVEFEAGLPSHPLHIFFTSQKPQLH